MNLDQFAIENEARAYRQRRMAQVEHERRLALLDLEWTPFSRLPVRLAARFSGTWRGAHTALVALLGGGFDAPPRPSMTVEFRKEL